MSDLIFRNYELNSFPVKETHVVLLVKKKTNQSKTMQNELSLTLER